MKVKITVDINKWLAGELTTSKTRVFSSVVSLKRALSKACAAWRAVHGDHSQLTNYTDWAEHLMRAGTVCLEQTADNAADIELWTIAKCEDLGQEAEEDEKKKRSLSSMCIHVAEEVMKAKRAHKKIPHLQLGLELYRQLGLMTAIDISREAAELGRQLIG